MIEERTISPLREHETERVVGTTDEVVSSSELFDLVEWLARECGVPLSQLESSMWTAIPEKQSATGTIGTATAVDRADGGTELPERPHAGVRSIRNERTAVRLGTVVRSRRHVFN